MEIETEWLVVMVVESGKVLEMGMRAERLLGVEVFPAMVMMVGKQPGIELLRRERVKPVVK